MKYCLAIFFLSACCLGFAQQTEYVNFKNVKVEISIVPELKKVTGEVVYDFEIIKDVDSIYLDAISMKFENVFLNNEKFEHHNDSNKLWLIKSFEKGQSYRVSFNYEVVPKKALYFINWNNPSTSSGQVWTQGQGKYTSNWLPSIDDMNDKIEFDLSITFDSDYEVIANGKLTNQQINESTTTWHYDMQKPMSSYLVALAIGKYHKKVEYSKSGTPLEMYYYPEDSLKFEPTYRYTKRMFDFLEEEIGVTYPWQNYKMVPVKDFLYAGMENTSLNIYSDTFVVDSIAFVDKNFVNINAHELAHQWFGDLVTETSGTHHWLQEGFATYYALLAEKEIFGEDYYYWRLYEYAQELLEQDKAGKSTSLLDLKSSSTTFYKKGAWVLHILREKVGDKAFKEAVKNYLLKYQYKNVETNDFINEVEMASGENLDVFVKEYLEKKDNYFLNLKIKDFEYRLVDLKIGLKLLRCGMGEDMIAYNSKLSEIRFKSLFADSLNSFAKVHVFENFLKDTLVNNKEKYSNIFNSKDIKLRQAVAQNIAKIPLGIKSDYESLLNDKSYITIEAALFNLWRNFPADRTKYLNQTKGIVGFNDKNVRVLWLTLALITEEYEPENKKQYFDKLTEYTSEKYSFEVRQNAFQYLRQIKACNENCKKNLNQATKHHNWRFSKFAKALLKAN